MTAQKSRFFTLLQREFQEYRNSFLWTPLIMALLLGLLMLGSVILVNSISVFGDAILEAVMEDGTDGFNISISVGEDEDDPMTAISAATDEVLANLPEDLAIEYHEIVEDGDEGSSGTARIELDQSSLQGEVPLPPVPADLAPGHWEVVVEEDDALEQWNFSREWRFEPPQRNDHAKAHKDMSGRELNPILGVVHGILLLTLLLTSANYLLGSLYDDRKDRSILFWRSMPVSEWEIVLSKFVVALVVAPLIYIAISLVLQLSYVLLMMLLVWRMEQDPFAVILGNIDFVALMIDPLSAWIMTAVLIAPTYAWLLFASALARRSPFIMAIVPVLALAIVEGLFLGSNYVDDAVTRHFPHISDGSAVGFYIFGPDWSHVNLLSMFSGLLFAAGAMAAAVWLRVHRWELK